MATGDKFAKQYRAVITGTVVDNSVYGNMELGAPHEMIVGPVSTIPAIKGKVTTARRDWPYNERNSNRPGHRPVIIDSVRIEEAEITWKEINV